MTSRGGKSFAAGHVERRADAITVIPPGQDWPPVLADHTQPFLDATNAFRTTHGAQPLRLLAPLEASASWKSEHMAMYDYLDHDDPAPPLARTVWDRFADNGYHGAAGENICYGSGLAPDAAVALLVSAGPGEGHYENIVSRTWTVCGVAAARDEAGNVFYTQDFGVEPPSGPAPRVQTVQPATGKAGDTVQLLGTHLFAVTQVVFATNVAAAGFAAVNDDRVDAVVPAGAVSGPVVVVTPGGFAASPAFTVAAGPPTPPPPAPGLTPASGQRWRNKHTGVVVVVDRRTTASVVWYRNVTTDRVGSRVTRSFVNAYEPVPA